MKVEIVLHFGGVLFNFTNPDEYDTLTDAQFDWMVGARSCDCERSDILKRHGAIESELPCNTGNNKIQLIALKPFVLH